MDPPIAKVAPESESMSRLIESTPYVFQPLIDKYKRMVLMVASRRVYEFSIPILGITTHERRGFLHELDQQIDSHFIIIHGPTGRLHFYDKRVHSSIPECAHTCPVHSRPVDVFELDSDRFMQGPVEIKFDT